MAETARKLFTFYSYADGDEKNEEIFRCESRQGCECLADLYLFSKTKPKTSTDYTAKVALEAFMSAEEAGMQVVELPTGKALRNITVIDVLQLLNKVKVDVQFIGATPEDVDGDAVVNPTVTQGESL